MKKSFHHILLPLLSIVPVLLMLVLVEGISAALLAKRKVSPEQVRVEVSPILSEKTLSVSEDLGLNSLPIAKPAKSQQMGPEVFFEPTTTSWGNFSLPRERGAVVLPSILLVQDVLRGAGDKIWFDKTYRTDDRGYRITSAKTLGEHTGLNSSVFFLGCSFTFGIGVNDDETLPSQFARFSGATETWNMGIPAGSPATALRLLEVRGLPSKPKGKGFALFWSIDHHILRTVGSMTYIGVWGSRLPFYEESKTPNELLHFVGSYEEAHPLTNLLFWLGAKSSFLRMINFDWPSSFTKEHFGIWGKHMLSMRNLIRSSHPKLTFVVVLSPDNRRFGGYMAMELERNGIPYLDYTALLPRLYIEKPAHYPDGHPTPAYNEFFGRQLARDLASPKL
jgi:hypothetical protein